MQMWLNAQRKQVEVPPSNNQQQHQAFLHRIRQAQDPLDAPGVRHGDGAVSGPNLQSSAEPSTVISNVISAMRSGLSAVRALLPASLRKILDGEAS